VSQNHIHKREGFGGVMPAISSIHAIPSGSYKGLIARLLLKRLIHTISGVVSKHIHSRREKDKKGSSYASHAISPVCLAVPYLA
jgi:hypothetical protein